MNDALLRTDVSVAGTRIAGYEVHPIAEAFPLLEGDDLRELAENIREHGLLHPIVLLEGKILDGRNRLRACELAGVEPRFVPWSGDGDPFDWVVVTNLHRRHLSTSQRALVAVELKKQYELKALERKRAGRPPALRSDAADEALPEAHAEVAVPAGVLPAPEEQDDASLKGKASAHAARRAHVSARTVERAERLVSAAAPELIDAVRSGVVTVSAAAEVAKLPADEQRTIVRERKVSERARAMRDSPKPAKIVQAPPEPVVSDDSLPLNLRDFKAMYKKGPPPPQRQPVHEVARLDQIAVTATLVERAWTWIAVEWDADLRQDMVFAVEEAKRMTPLIVEFGERLAEIIARCRGVSEERAASEERDEEVT